MRTERSPAAATAASLFVFLPLWACSHQGEVNQADVIPPSPKDESRPDTVDEDALAEMRRRLDLTDDQLEKVQPILQVAGEARRAILSRHGITLPPDGKPETKLGILEARRLRNDLEKVEAEAIAQLDHILTAEQLDQYQKLQQEKRQSMRERILGGR